MVSWELARDLADKVLYGVWRLLGPGTGLAAFFGLAPSKPITLPGLRNAVSEWEEFRNKGQKAWVWVPALSSMNYLAGKELIFGGLFLYL